MSSSSPSDDRPAATFVFGDVVSADSPARFHFRPRSRREEALHLRESLNAAARTSGSTSGVASGLARGSLVGVRHRGEYRRAQVTAGVVKGRVRVRVRLVDVGEVVEVPSSSCFALPDGDLRRQLPLAERAHLSDVVASPALPGAWAEEARAEFHRMVTQCPGVYLQPRGAPVLASDGGRSLPCELYLEERVVDSCLAAAGERTARRAVSAEMRRRGHGHLTITMMEEEEDDEDEASSSAPGGGSDADTQPEDDDDVDHRSPSSSIVRRWPAPRIPARRRFRARVTHVSQLGQIYAQPCGRGEEDLDRRIRRALTHKHEEMLAIPLEEDEDASTGRRWRRGDAAVARFDADGRWYRAMVLEGDDDDGGLCATLAVQFVDYGNARRVRRGEVRPAEEFGSVPVLAVRVALLGVSPWPHSAANPSSSPSPSPRGWSPQVLDWMQSRLIFQRRGAVRLTRGGVVTLANSLPLPVRLEFKRGRRWTDFARVLASRGLAELTTDEATSVSMWSQRELLEDAFGVEGVPEEEGEENDSNASASSASTSSSSSSTFPESGAVASPFPPQRLNLHRNLIIRVFVELVVSLGEVYVHVLGRGQGGAGGGGGAVVRSAEHQSMFERLQRAAESSPPPSPAALRAAVDTANSAAARTGAPVAARAAHDGAFHRAYLLRRPKNGECVVRYVDVGSVERVAVSSLRCLPADFLAIPGFAVRVALDRRACAEELDGGDDDDDGGGRLRALQRAARRAQSRGGLFVQVKSVLEGGNGGDPTVLGDLLLQRDGGYRRVV